jgi:hypothetical protein
MATAGMRENAGGVRSRFVDTESILMPWLWHSPTMTRRGVDAECRSDGAFFGPRSREWLARSLARLFTA